MSLSFVLRANFVLIFVFFTVVEILNVHVRLHLMFFVCVSVVGGMQQARITS